MGRHKHWARFALAFALWTASWTIMTVALTKHEEPWPWGGLALFMALTAVTATVWWIVECVACREVQHLRDEVQALRQDRERLPDVLAEAVARALAVRRVGG